MSLLFHYLHMLNFSPHVVRLRIFFLLYKTLKHMAVLKQKRAWLVFSREAGLDHLPRLGQLLRVRIFQGVQVSICGLS